jgi:hypothetical protein
MISDLGILLELNDCSFEDMGVHLLSGMGKSVMPHVCLLIRARVAIQC